MHAGAWWDTRAARRPWWYTPHVVRRWYTKPAAWINKKDIFAVFAYEFEPLHKSRRSRVYHQNEVLHIINSAGIVYHHCESTIQPTADDIHLRWWDTRVPRDDIPLLLQWIKNRQVETCRFLAEKQRFEVSIFPSYKVQKNRNFQRFLIVRKTHKSTWVRFRTHFGYGSYPLDSF